MQEGRRSGNKLKIEIFGKSAEEVRKILVKFVLLPRIGTHDRIKYHYN
jgi:hypothetical protein